MIARAAADPTPPIVANPVLVGAVTTLVIVVAVFLAYNANNGLPFVPTRQLDVLVSNGANLVKGNEVRSGGFRVGVVTDMQPVMLPEPQGRRAGSRSSSTRRPARSRRLEGRHPAALGARPEVRRARHRAARRRSSPTAPRMPATQASVPVELDEVYNMFDEPTRRASQGNLQGFGDALAGRGADLNQTIQVAPELFGHLGSVMANLSAPRTELPSLLQGARRRRAHRRAGLEDQRAPLHDDGQHLRGDLARPAGAQGRRSPRARRRCARAPARCACSARSSSTPPRCRATSTRPTTELRGALPTVNSALRVGTPVQRRSVALNDNLQGALGALEDLVKAPTTVGSLRGLTATVGTLQPQLRYLGPYVTVCNSWNIFWTFAAEHLSAPDDTGSSQRALLNMATQTPGTDGIGSSGANEFAHGKGALPEPRRPVRAQQRLRARPSTRRATPTAAPARPATSRPTTRCATRASRATPTRAPSRSASPITRAPGPDLRAVRQERQGPRPEPRPRAGRRDVHRPAGRPRRRHREGRSHEAQAAARGCPRSPPGCSRSRCSPS